MYADEEIERLQKEVKHLGKLLTIAEAWNYKLKGRVNTLEERNKTDQDKIKELLSEKV